MNNNWKLNQTQEKIVKAPLKPYLILAGAGSGKTHVLTQRISYLINHYKISPSKIWAITFTNKAANEIKKRVEAACKYAPYSIATFHSSCSWILRKHINFLGRDRNFRVMDDLDQINLVKRIIKNLNLTNFEFTPKKIVYMISFFKNNLYSSKEITKEVFKNNFSSIFNEIDQKNIKNIYHTYEEFLNRENLLDFDDLLLYAQKLLKIPEVLDYWQKKFDAILIDEFQDTNELQFDIVCKIAGENQNILAVGDPDQSIYGWRGAYSNIIEDFQTKFLGTEIILLEQNYRSTKKILNIANTLIRNNTNRIEKNLFTDNDDGEQIEAFHADDSEDEANWIADKIISLNKNNVPLNNILVLYRINALSKALEEALIRKEIGYTIYGSVKFYQRKEIKDLVAYLNLVINNDSISLERIYNTPRRKLSLNTLEIFYKYALVNKISLYEAFFEVDKIEILSNLAINGVKQLNNILQKLRELKTENFTNLIDEVLEITEYQKSFDKDLEKYRFENIEWFKNTAQEAQNKNPQLTLDEYLTEIALYAASDEIDDNAKKVNLMSVHHAKGLEYDYVFVTNLNENTFPSYQSIFSFEQVEEERRIAYVAFTRAKKQLFLSCSKGFDFKTKFDKKPSRFWDEVINLKELTENKRKWTFISKKEDGFFDSKNKKRNDLAKNYLANQRKFQIGERVVHEKYGQGVVVEIGKLGSMTLLKIQFKNYKTPIEVISNHKALKYLLN